MVVGVGVVIAMAQSGVWAQGEGPTTAVASHNPDQDSAPARPRPVAEVVAERARIGAIWVRVKRGFCAAVARRVEEARQRLNSLRRGVLGLASAGAVVVAAQGSEGDSDREVHVTRCVCDVFLCVRRYAPCGLIRVPSGRGMCAS